MGIKLKNLAKKIVLFTQDLFVYLFKLISYGLKACLRGIRNLYFDARAKASFIATTVIILIAGIIFSTFPGGSPQFVMAINDQIKTWTFPDDATDFTYAAPVTVDGAGLKPPVNKFSNANFGSNITGWDSSLVIPAGWVLVPGNTTFGTSDFLVMKYEAKCAALSDLTTGLITPVISTGSYDYNASNCTAANSKRVVSLASGYPIANLTQPEAITLGQTLGTSYHLINNNEWMTIARNAENVASNWSVDVGSGYMYSGHNDATPNNALTASTDDALGYTGTGNSSGNQRRTLTLSNNNVLWDLAGNVWEFTNNVQNPAIDTIAGWAEWDSANIAAGARVLYGPSSASYLSAQGMGKVYGGALNNVFLRGGGWGDVAGAGAFALYLNATVASRNGFLGLRLSSDSVAISPSSQSIISRAAGAAAVAVTGVADGTFTQSINVGDTANYALSAYAYNNTVGAVGGAVDGTVASLYAGGAAIATTYTPVVGAAGWYKLTNTNALAGVASSVTYGLLVKAGKTVVADDMTLAKAGNYTAYTTIAYNDAQAITWDSFAATESGTSANGTIHYQLCSDTVATCVADNSWQYWNGSAWATASDTTLANTAAELTLGAMQAFPVTNKKVGVKIIFSIEGSDTQPVVTSVAIGYTTDTVAPPNPSSITAKNTSDGSTTLTTGVWYNYAAPYFSWIAPTDLTNPGGTPSGVAGYYVYFGTSDSADPFSVGAWQTGTNYTAGSLSSGTYYFRIRTQDNAGNKSDSETLFIYKYDNLKPNSPKYISASPSGYTRTNSFTFLWPTTGANMATDTGGSELAAYQYKINDGAWSAGITEGSVTFDEDDAIAETGINIFYLRAVDGSGNADDSPAQSNFYYNASAPTAPTALAVVPATSSEDNSFAFSWGEPSSFDGSIAGYYYSINVLPTNANVSYTTAELLAAGPYATQQGENTFYIVAKDEAGNYDLTSCANISGNTDTDGCAKVSFTAATPAPGIPTGAQIFDISNRDTEEYAITLKWVVPENTGTGFTGYEIYRSIDNVSFASIGTTTGTAYADTELSSKLYYYYIKSKDNAGQYSAVSTTVSMMPTGKYTQAPILTEDPSVIAKAFSATVTWGTSREASSFVYMATSSSGVASAKATGTPEKIIKHEVILTGLQPETTYYYKVMWEDVDGNQGLSNNYSFQTALRPRILDVKTSDITLDSATISWKSTTIVNAALYYGKTTAYGGLVQESSGSSTTNHSIKLTDLEDGTVYHFQIVATDTDLNKIISDDYNFETLTMPKISEFGFVPVADAPTTTLKFSWKTNVSATSVVTYQAAGAGANSESKAELRIEHEIIVSDLSDQSVYTLQAKSVDGYGNTAESDLVTYTTPIDSRPPKVRNLVIEVKSDGFGSTQTAQVVVSWETDEPATSQVEYGPGISNPEYSVKTKEDAALTTTHVVIASGLDSSKIYHLQAVSKDGAGNVGTSEDTTVITGKIQKSILDIIIASLEASLGWMFKFFK